MTCFPLDSKASKSRKGEQRLLPRGDATRGGKRVSSREAIFARARELSLRKIKGCYNACLVFQCRDRERSTDVRDLNIA